MNARMQADVTGALKEPRPQKAVRQLEWSGLPFPPPGDLPDLGIKPVSQCRGPGFDPGSAN